ncbi:MAG: hypothetical protein U0354_03005 [Candidatus Sericytochromatia bacterium]
MTEKYEKVPDFIPVRIEEKEVKEVEKKQTPKIKELDSMEKYSFRDALTKPSRLKVDQSYTLVDFDSYKGDLSLLYGDISDLYKNINDWNEESVFNVASYVLDTDLNTVLNKIAYLPNHIYLGNIIEIIASLIINGGIDVGSIIDNENVFQSFKRIYTNRVQIVLLPFLFCVYNLDRKLLPIKKTAWSILNKNGRFFEASNIMSDIQKSMIRVKKCQELLTQEKFNIDDKFSENIDLLLLLSGQENILFPIFQAYKQQINNQEFNIESYLSSYYKVTPLKPFAQQLLTFKAGDYGNKIQSILSRWSVNSSAPQFKEFLSNSISTITEDMEFKADDFYNISKDIIFSIMDTSKKRNWNSIDTINAIVFSILDGIVISDTNRLRLISYTIGSQVIAGVLKVKYKIEEAVQGLALGLISLENDFQDEDKKRFFSDTTNHKIICEAVYNGIWDTAFEMYPNLLTIDKAIDLFINSFSKK